MIRSFALAKKWSIPKRYLSLKLFDGRNIDDLKPREILVFADVNANVSFSTTTSNFGLASQANITIVGLKPETMAFLSTAYRQWEEQPIFNEVRIEAGYDNNHGLIYDGTIIEAITNLNNANFSISLKCISLYNERSEKKISLSFEGKTKVSEIVDVIAKQIGAVPKYTEAAGNVEIESYSLSNASPIEHLRYVAVSTGLNVYVDKNGLCVKKPNEPATGIQPLEVDDKIIIGAPIPTAQGCNVSIRMNPNVSGGQVVKLTSTRFPQVNAKDYIVGTYYHTGETKGGKWETHLNLVREKFYDKA